MTNSNELEHHGVQGMKWGVRKAPTMTLSGNTKNGDTISLSQKPSGAISSFRQKHSPRYKEAVSKQTNLTITNKQGKKVGDLMLYKESPSSTNVIWLGVKSSQSNQGYGTAAMKSAIKYSKSKGDKTVTLEVPGNAPNAKAIYEKLGFKVDSKQNSNSSSNTDDIWGGLTSMTYTHKDSNLRHSGEEVDDGQEFIKLLIESIDEEMPSSELAHYGVLGMKWGVRRGRNASVKNLTNEQLSSAVRRLELEKRYSTLTTKEKSAAAKWTKNLLIGSATAVATKYTTDYMSKQVGSMIKKKAAKQVQLQLNL